jgi:hypothetical protein
MDFPFIVCLLCNGPNMAQVFFLEGNMAQVVKPKKDPHATFHHHNHHTEL